MIKISQKHSGSRKWWEVLSTKDRSIVGYIEQHTDGVFYFDPLNDLFYGEKTLSSVSKVLARLNKSSKNLGQ